MKDAKGEANNQLSNKDMNKYKSDVPNNKDVNFKNKQQALDFIKKKFNGFKQEIAGKRSTEGWHFDKHPINNSKGAIDHINIYSKQYKFRVHIT